MPQLTWWQWLSLVIGVSWALAGVWLGVVVWRFCDLCSRQDNQHWLERDK